MLYWSKLNVQILAVDLNHASMSCYKNTVESMLMRNEKQSPCLYLLQTWALCSTCTFTLISQKKPIKQKNWLFKNKCCNIKALIWMLLLQGVLLSGLISKVDLIFPHVKGCYVPVRICSCLSTDVCRFMHTGNISDKDIAQKLTHDPLHVLYLIQDLPLI